MFEKISVPRLLAAAVFCVALLEGPAWGQEAKKGGSVPITFVPPPMENATYSLGIYDAKTGKLARRLCEAAGQDTFKIGLNGLITSWDGKNDDGKPLPPGKYAARGYAVGPLKVEGEAILGNDWAQDDRDLRVMRVEKIACVPVDEGLAAILKVGSDRWVVACFKGSDGSLVWQKPVAAPFQTLRATGVAICGLEATGERLIVTGPDKKRTEYQPADGAARALPDASSVALPNGKTALGKNESVWKIEDGVLSQHSLKGEVSRSLEPKKTDPLPVAVAASTKSERLYLLENKDDWQRVRGLAWVDVREENGKPISTWQTFFERNIRPSDPVKGQEDAEASGSSSTVEVPLTENPLAPGRNESAKLTATFDEKGSYLSTLDGLRLRQISQRVALRAAKLTEDKAGGTLVFFQADGAAWDQFSIKGAREIVSFDAGEFEIDAAGEKPVAEKAAEPDL